MTGIWRGPMRLPEAKPTLTTHPTVAPLPSPDAPTPRRLYGVVCAHLRIDGKPVQFFRPVSRESAGNEIKTGHCTARNAGITGSLIIDLCSSSWSRQCPFLPEQEHPRTSAPRRMVAPSGEPGERLYACNDCEQLKPRDAFKWYLQAVGTEKRYARCFECQADLRGRVA